MADMLNHLLPALFGLIGVLVGGLITFLTEKHFRKNQSKRNRHITLSRVMDKFANICDDLHSIRKQLYSDIPEEHSGQTWPLVRTFVSGNDERIHFTSDEMIPFFSEENTEISTRLKSLAANRNTLHEVLKLYKFEREKLDDMIEPFATYEMGNPVAKIQFDIDEQPQLVKRITSVESLIETIFKDVEEDYAKAKSLVEDLNAAFKSIEGPATKLSISWVASDQL